MSWCSAARTGLATSKLVAYVAPADGAPRPGVGELRQHTAAGLPDYMVPNVVCFVDAFPPTSNGKLDREALPWPAEPGSVHVLSAPAPGTGEVAAAPGDTALATEIAEIFRELLETTAIGLDDDLWDLPPDSLHNGPGLGRPPRPARPRGSGFRPAGGADRRGHREGDRGQRALRHGTGGPSTR